MPSKKKSLLDNKINNKSNNNTSNKNKSVCKSKIKYSPESISKNKSKTSLKPTLKRTLKTPLKPTLKPTLKSSSKPKNKSKSKSSKKIMFGGTNIISASVGVITSMVDLGKSVFNEMGAIAMIGPDMNKAVSRPSSIPSASDPPTTFEEADLDSIKKR